MTGTGVNGETHQARKAREAEVVAVVALVSTVVFVAVVPVVMPVVLTVARPIDRMMTVDLAMTTRMRRMRRERWRSTSQRVHSRAVRAIAR